MTRRLKREELSGLEELLRSIDRYRLSDSHTKQGQGRVELCGAPCEGKPMDGKDGRMEEWLGRWVMVAAPRPQYPRTIPIDERAIKADG